MQTVVPCCCAASGTCSVTINAKGCNNLLLPGMTFQLWDNTVTTLLDTQTTDGSGNTTFTWSGTTGFYQIIPTSVRFVGQPINVFVCGVSVNLSFTPSSAYHCMIGCAVPLAKALHATHNFYGAANTSGTYTYNYPPAAFPCTGGTVHPSGGFNAATASYTDSFDSTGGFNCPSDGAPNVNTESYSVTSSSCPPSFSWTGSYVIDGTSPQPVQLMYGYSGTPITASVTVTE